MRDLPDLPRVGDRMLSDIDWPLLATPDTGEDMPMKQNNPGSPLDGWFGTGTEASNPEVKIRKHAIKRPWRRPWRGPVGPTGTQKEYRHS